MKRFALILLFFIVDNAHSESNFWNLPQVVSDENARVSFTVDSTWHTVHGTTSEVSGRVWLADSNDYRSLRADISIPVATFDTDNGSRDEKLRAVMAAQEYKVVRYQVSEVLELCSPTVLLELRQCPLVVRGKMNIRGKEQIVEFKGNVFFNEAESGYRIEMMGELKWQDFAVEDPSIFIAKLNQVVSISVSLRVE